MADRGKIVKGMECCVSGEHSECPYRDRDNDNGMLKCWNELMRDALELLKEQEPVKPVDRWDHGFYYACGSCGKELGIILPSYCQYCGKAVKLDD